ncbi:hypothetical protein CASFOL_041502 [Castilleja foliolosa]|uniref:Uncharacterized protein n=1 Tax=Castilleja foliolosa TaxID=1961234 RepID=A0ABD3BBJ2_9LAMI
MIQPGASESEVKTTFRQLALQSIVFSDEMYKANGFPMTSIDNEQSSKSVVKGGVEWEALIFIFSYFSI